MSKKKFIFLLVLLVISSLAIAQEEIDYSEDTFYENPTFFQSEGFDWSHVDWSKIDWSNREMYNSPGFYENVPDVEYAKSVDYNLVDYQLVNHDKVDLDKYFMDLSEGSLKGKVELEEDYGDPFDEDLGWDGSLIYSSDGITHGGTGDFVSVPGNYPNGVFFQFDSVRIFVFLPEGQIELISPPDSDTIYIILDKSVVGKPIFISHKGHSLSQSVKFIEGQLYSSNTLVDGIVVSSRIPLFFDGEPHGEEYFSISEERVRAKSLKRNFISFEGNNRFFDSKNQPRFSIDNAELIVNSRKGLNPFVTVINYGDDQAQVLTVGNGPLELNYAFGELYQNRFKFGGKETAPFSMVILDKERNNILGRNEKGRIVFDEVGNYVVIPANLDQSEFDKLECSGCELDFTNSPVVNDATSASLDKLNIPIVYTFGVKELNSIELNQLYQELNSLTPETRESVKEIVFFPDDQILVYCSNVASSACASHDGKIMIPHKSIKGLHQVFAHEAGHTFDFDFSKKLEGIRVLDTSQIEFGVGISEDKTKWEWEVKKEPPPKGCIRIYNFGYACDGFPRAYAKKSKYEYLAVYVQCRKTYQCYSRLKDEPGYKENFEILCKHKFIYCDK